MVVELYRSCVLPPPPCVCWSWRNTFLSGANVHALSRCSVGAMYRLFLRSVSRVLLCRATHFVAGSGSVGGVGVGVGVEVVSVEVVGVEVVGVGVGRDVVGLLLLLWLPMLWSLLLLLSWFVLSSLFPVSSMLMSTWLRLSLFHSRFLFCFWQFWQFWQFSPGTGWSRCVEPRCTSWRTRRATCSTTPPPRKRG